MGEGASGGSDAHKAGAALGAMLGMALVDRMVDAMVRPEFVMQAMADGKLRSPAKRPKEEGGGMGGSAGGSTGGGSVEAKRPDVKWTTERKGVDRIVVYGSDADAPADKGRQVGFVFDREGFAGWKLTEVRLPADR